jgi:hypothetical protein
MHCSFQNPTAHEGELVTYVDNVCTLPVFNVSPDVIGHQYLKSDDWLRNEAANAVEVSVSIQHDAVSLLRLLRCKGFIDHISKHLETQLLVDNSMGGRIRTIHRYHVSLEEFHGGSRGVL